mmetsp:Transcript_84410/g.234012  ORF Transcript_84410/g.234012 Transcript_84410/m.234012 type:complete len:216 (+) Transcript_84410:1402-2049(+)
MPTSHAAPPFRGSLTVRTRARWPLWLHSPQVLQEPTSQSFTSPAQKPWLQTTSSSRPPSHGSPPLAATLRTARVRCFSPPKQLFVQEVQSLQLLSSQGWERPGVEQNCVSERPPSQGAPPFSASCWIMRFRYFWSCGEEHSLQSCQLESTQSCTLWHACPQRLVSTKLPSQAWPPHDPSVLMTLVLSQSWLQEGLLHSLHSLRTQSVAAHSAVQL